MTPIAALLLATAAPPPFAGELVLDIERPVVEAVILGQTVRLRVEPQAQDVVELNPDAAVRVGVPFTDSFPAQVGRAAVQGWRTPAEVTIGGRVQRLTIASHARRCCEGVDGEISPALLPYARVRLVRANAGSAPVVRWALPLAEDAQTGLHVRQETSAGLLRVTVSLVARETLATAASGAILAGIGGGRLDPGTVRYVHAFGVERAVRRLTLAEPVTLAGFRIDRALVRSTDFGGRYRLPRPAVGAAPADLTVTGRRRRPQAEWTAVSIGRDLIDRCREIAIDRAPATIAFTCAP